MRLTWGLAVRGGEVLQAGGNGGEQDLGQHLVSHTLSPPSSAFPFPLHERQHARADGGVPDDGCEIQSIGRGCSQTPSREKSVG
jgi:hypothetical protein